MDYHDALAVLGVGSAHPGGMESTFHWMNAIPIQKDWSVLDIGCGTGRTACQIAKSFGCKTTAIDIRPKMIQMAKKRSILEHIKVDFFTGDAEHLSFSANQFDLVITESVNVFLDSQKAISEYIKVLKPGGIYVDVEMMTLIPVTKEWRESVKKVYGAKYVPDLAGWKKIYQTCGFENIKTLGAKPVRPEDAFKTQQDYPDLLQLSTSSPSDAHIFEILKQNSEWLEQNHRFLGFGIFCCTKPITSFETDSSS